MSTVALPTASNAAARRRLVGLLRARRRGVGAVLALTALANVAGVLGPALIGRVVDAVADGTPTAGSRIDTAALLYAGLVVVSGLLTWRAGVAAATVGEDALAELRTEVFDASLDLPAGTVERAGTGDLVSRLGPDVALLAQTTSWILPFAVFSMVNIVLTLVALLLVDPRLALVGLGAAAPLIGAAGRWYFRRAPVRYRAERERAAELSVGLHEAYHGAPTLWARRAVAPRLLAMAGRGRAQVDAELSSTNARNVLRPAITIGQGVAIAAVLAVSAVLVERGQLSVGAAAASLLYLARLIQPVSELMELLDNLQAAFASLARLVGITEARPAVVAGSSGPAPVDRAATVRLAGVTFGYDPADPVLHEIDLDVAAGERIVLVGPSGAGKTTLALLLAGLLTPQHGRIEVGGWDLAALSADDRHRLVALVPQEPHVFARRVADNVALADATIGPERVDAALAAVGAGRWVPRLPDGVDTVVGRVGHPLDPRAATELGLARLVAADPAVVVLDEATADLDASGAGALEHRLEVALAGRTVIAVAHRLDIAATADRVVVVEGGSVAELGTHEALLHAGGSYARLWEVWQASRG